MSLEFDMSRNLGYVIEWEMGIGKRCRVGGV